MSILETVKTISGNSSLLYGTEPPADKQTSGGITLDQPVQVFDKTIKDNLKSFHVDRLAGGWIFAVMSHTSDSNQNMIDLMRIIEMD